MLTQGLWLGPVFRQSKLVKPVVPNLTIIKNRLKGLFIFMSFMSSCSAMGIYDNHRRLIAASRARARVNRLLPYTHHFIKRGLKGLFTNPCGERLQ